MNQLDSRLFIKSKFAIGVIESLTMDEDGIIMHDVIQLNCNHRWHHEHGRECKERTLCIVKQEE